MVDKAVMKGILIISCPRDENAECLPVAQTRDENFFTEYYVQENLNPAPIQERTTSRWPDLAPMST